MIESMHYVLFFKFIWKWLAFLITRLIAPWRFVIVSPIYGITSNFLSLKMHKKFRVFIFWCTVIVSVIVFMLLFLRHVPVISPIILVLTRSRLWPQSSLNWVYWTMRSINFAISEFYWIGSHITIVFFCHYLKLLFIPWWLIIGYRIISWSDLLVLHCLRRISRSTRRRTSYFVIFFILRV